MSTIKMLSELPTDCIMNIQSFLLGRPEDLRIKHNENLKAIQQKYKIEYDRANIFSGYCIYPICMMYSIKSQNIKPHMINSKKNITRIVNFINNFQYGYPNDDFDYSDKDEIERYNSFFNVDVENDDDIDLNDDELKIHLTLTSVWKCKYTSEIMGEVEFNKDYEKTYIFHDLTKKGLKKTFTKYVESIPNFIRSRQDINLKLRNFRIEVEIRKRDDTDED